ncbi:MAG TPA: hypothetical protein VGH28_02090 [Polyangiaceae bacterium]|jgi:hypothetical protein
MDLLESRFAAAKLACAVTAQPIERARAGESVDVVQIDIARVRKLEEFRVWRGAAGNRVEVTAIDRALRQLVLLVWEPERAFHVTVARNFAPQPRGKIVSEDKYRRVIEQFTVSRRRHFLCGMDESHLFIAQLPRPVPTVADARRALRPTEIAPETKRQGEWFFVEPTAEDLAEIDRALVRERMGIAAGGGLVRAGRQHVAAEFCTARGRIFVRGAIRHPDHRTVRFRHWMRAVPNTEAFEQPAGVRWVD